MALGEDLLFVLLKRYFLPSYFMIPVCNSAWLFFCVIISLLGKKVWTVRDVFSYPCICSANALTLSKSRMAAHFFVDRPSVTTLTRTPNNVTLLRNSNMILSCSTDANPIASVYRFYFNGKLIDSSSSGVLNVTVKADGVYTCVPVNTVGTGDNATLSVTAVGKLTYM